MRVLYCRSSTNKSKAWICLLVVVCCGDDTVVQLAEEANIVDGDLDGGGTGEVELDPGLYKYCLPGGELLVGGTGEIHQKYRDQCCQEGCPQDLD